MNITVQELHEKLSSGENFLLIDVRQPWENEEFSLDTGKLIPLDALMNNLWELDAHKNDEIIVYCRSGNRSGMAQALMQAQGFSNVRNLTGGMIAWREVYGNAKS